MSYVERGFSQERRVQGSELLPITQPMHFQRNDVHYLVGNPSPSNSVTVARKTPNTPWETKIFRPDNPRYFLMEKEGDADLIFRNGNWSLKFDKETSVNLYDTPVNGSPIGQGQVAVVPNTPEFGIIIDATKFTFKRAPDFDITYIQGAGNSSGIPYCAHENPVVIKGVTFIHLGNMVAVIHNPEVSSNTSVTVIAPDRTLEQNPSRLQLQQPHSELGTQKNSLPFGRQLPLDLNRHFGTFYYGVAGIHSLEPAISGFSINAATPNNDPRSNQERANMLRPYCQYNSPEGFDLLPYEISREELPVSMVFVPGIPTREEAILSMNTPVEGGRGGQYYSQLLTLPMLSAGDALRFWGSPYFQPALDKYRQNKPLFGTLPLGKIGELNTQLSQEYIGGDFLHQHLSHLTAAYRLMQQRNRDIQLQQPLQKRGGDKDRIKTNDIYRIVVLAGPDELAGLLLGLTLMFPEDTRALSFNTFSPPTNARFNNNFQVTGCCDVQFPRDRGARKWISPDIHSFNHEIKGHLLVVDTFSPNPFPQNTPEDVSALQALCPQAKSDATNFLRTLGI